ncbi:MAG: adenylyltransferase/cytidyltransferase family protein [Candidatus Hydrogenedentes bacterium]|nr:adenylyltransferase/cytidyltransferase family protein [Candidatus Hydrogenedentota bacterium]
MAYRHPDKIYPDPHDLVPVIEKEKQAGKTIVLTNGVFDLLHVGHLRCLLSSRNEGDLLIVALNSDDYVCRHKTPDGPVNPLAARMELISGFACVDYVTSFDGDTASDILRLLKPHVHAKGTDYSSTMLPERETNRELGIKMAFVGDPKQHSSTDLRQHASSPPTTSETDVP